MCAPEKIGARSARASRRRAIVPVERGLPSIASMRTSHLLGFAAIAGLGLSACDQDPLVAVAAVAPSTGATASDPELATSLRKPIGAFPWLPGFVATAATTERSPDAVEQLGAWRDPDVPCSVSDARMIRADVAPAEGDETVMASVGAGVLVLGDGGGDALGASPLADCGGSGDGVIALAAGDAWIGRPTIAVVYTVGGHREADTTLALFAVGEHRLDPLWSGVIAVRDGRETREGAAALVPGVLLLRTPSGELDVNVFDRGTRRFEHVRAAAAAR